MISLLSTTSAVQCSHSTSRKTLHRRKHSFRHVSTLHQTLARARITFLQGRSLTRRIPAPTTANRDIAAELPAQLHKVYEKEIVRAKRSRAQVETGIWLPVLVETITPKTSPQRKGGAFWRAGGSGEPKCDGDIAAFHNQRGTMLTLHFKKNSS